MHMNEPWNVFGPFDYVRELKDNHNLEGFSPGEYYIARTFFMGKGTIKVSRGWYPLALVKHAYSRGYIAVADVSHCIIANKHVPGNLFSKFCEEVVKQFPSESKALINMLVGSFGSLFSATPRDIAVFNQLNEPWKCPSSSAGRQQVELRYR